MGREKRKEMGGREGRERGEGRRGGERREKRAERRGRGRGRGGGKGRRRRRGEREGKGRGGGGRGGGGREGEGRGRGRQGPGGSCDRERATLRHVDPTRPPRTFARRTPCSQPPVSRVHLSSCQLEARPAALASNPATRRQHVMFPTAVLETTGAKTGVARRNAIIYFHDGGQVVIAASNAGNARNPSWFHNLRAHPDVVFGGVAMRASLIDDEAEQRRLWPLADNVFPAFASYRPTQRRCTESFRWSGSHRGLISLREDRRSCAWGPVPAHAGDRVPPPTLHRPSAYPCATRRRLRPLPRDDDLGP